MVSARNVVKTTAKHESCVALKRLIRILPAAARCSHPAAMSELVWSGWPRIEGGSGKPDRA